MDDKQADFIALHRVFTGNCLSITFVYDKLTLFAFGRLVALYEHRVFVEGVLFRINSFDQWGVELGKELATGLLPVIEGKERPATTPRRRASSPSWRSSRSKNATLQQTLPW